MHTISEAGTVSIFLLGQPNVFYAAAVLHDWFHLSSDYINWFKFSAATVLCEWFHLPSGYINLFKSSGADRKTGSDWFISHPFQFIFFSHPTNWHCVICIVDKGLLNDPRINQPPTRKQKYRRSLECCVYIFLLYNRHRSKKTLP
jgi:hypothetical protein